MTTTTSVPDEGPCDERWALDPFQGLRQLLPRIAIPSWVRLIGEQMDAPRKKAIKPSTPAQRCMRRNERRLLRTLAGEHTRARKTTA